MTSRDTVGTRTRKLRSFSGAKDSEPGVVDYDTWRMYASSVVDSTRLSENERKRILIDSLLRPALDIATTLDATKTSQDLLHVLDHHYGEVSDGYELYTQFRSSIQDVKETACEYLQKLHLLALKATQREGMRKQLPGIPAITVDSFPVEYVLIKDQPWPLIQELQHLRVTLSPLLLGWLLSSFHQMTNFSKDRILPLFFGPPATHR